MRTTNILAVIVVLLIIGMAYGLSRNNTTEKTILNLSLQDYEDEKTKVDSLNKVVDSLQTELFMLEDSFDYKEHRYEDTIFQYELGLSYLKDYHYESYKAFHRFLAHKEKYSKQDERENTKILNQYKTNPNESKY